MKDDESRSRVPREELVQRTLIPLLFWLTLVGAGTAIVVFNASREALALGASAVVIVGIALVRQRRRQWSESRRDELASQPTWSPIETDEVMAAVETFGQVDGQTGARFLQLMTEPRTQVVRLTERLTPLSRSTEITSTLEVALEGEQGKIIVLPLVRRRRGYLDGGLSVHDHDGRAAPVLPKADGLAYALLSIRSVLATLGPIVDRVYRSSIEPWVVRALCESPDEGDLAFLDAIRALAEPGDDRTRTVVQAVLVLALYDFTIIETRLPAATRDTSDPRTLALVRQSRLLRFVVRRRDVLVYEPPTGRSIRAAAAFRSAFGIPVSTIFVRLDDAHSARSYHAEVVGPEQTYVARQTIYEGDVIGRPQGQVAALHRLGQRHAHLYLRTQGPLVGWRYAVTYFERMPSSMAAVAVAALALALLATLGWVTVLLSPMTEFVGHPAFAATLLGVPSAISIWSGVQRGRSSGAPGAGGLFPVVGTAITIVFAVAAVVINVELGEQPAAWALLAIITGSNAVLFCGAWFVRARFVHSLLYFQPERPARSESAPSGGQMSSESGDTVAQR